MKKIVICGGNSLSGEVEIHGAKNSLLPILAAVVLASGECKISNCPPLSDVLTMLDLLRDIGCKIEYADQTVRIDTRSIHNYSMNDGLMHKLRSSIFILGPLLARMGKAELGYPGGCDIGIRPIDLHLKGLRDLGVTVTETEGHVLCSCSRLQGSEVYLDYPSVGATENVMMAASLAQGATVICNAAKEPEIVDLQNFINKMGGRISGAGTGRIVIHGVERLEGCEYSAMPDRIVTGTFMIASALTKGEIFIKNAQRECVNVLAGKLRDGGCEILDEDKGIVVRCHDRFKASNIIETMPYPGFPTDLQSPMMTLQTVAKGTCILIENVFENRFRLTGELKKMGADITVKDRMAVIRGVEKLKGATVNTHDLRGGAALVLAGLAADGITVVKDDGLIDRGYFELEKQLKALGGEIVVLEE
ncbi:MAG: UDP-N-acetylglucosamine 1-carboxyvinyltransferase [Clostridia bacterium]|nr:UDP-N-acetylglucosamine 1-carboxyvinyltransferase [Clostridia bacterium]